MTIYQNSISQTSYVETLRIQSPIWKTFLAQPIKALDNFLVKSQRKAIVKSALIAVVSQNPDWSDACFDQHFVANQGAATMSGYFETGQLPTAAALADAWSEQFRWKPTAKLNAQLRFMPIADDFVHILSTEEV